MVVTRKLTAACLAPALIMFGPIAAYQLRLATCLLGASAQLAPGTAASQNKAKNEGYYLTITPPQPSPEELNSRWAHALQHPKRLAELLQMTPAELESTFNRFDTPANIRSMVEQYLENYRSKASS